MIWFVREGGVFLLERIVAIAVWVVIGLWIIVLVWRRLR